MKQSIFNMIVPLEEGNFILYNTLYNGIIELDKVHLDYLSSDDILVKESASEEFLQAYNCFCENNFLVEDDMDEISYLQYEYNKNAFDHSTLVLAIAPTLLCNFKCPYCYETPKKGIFAEQEINAIVEFVRDKYNDDCFKKLKINWYGGEPMLAFSQICSISNQLIDFCENNSIEYSANMVSNGSLIDEANAKQMKDIKISTVQITLDGIGEYQDKRRPARNGQRMVDTIIQGMKSMNDLGITVSCRVNVDKKNIDEYYKISKYFEDYINIHVHVGHLRNYNQLSSNEYDFYTLEEFGVVEHKAFMESGYTLEDLENILGCKKVFCGAYADNNFVIDNHCNVYKCWNDIGKAEKIVFNLLEAKETRIVSFKPLVEYMCYNPFADEECSQCNLLPLCAGGCFFERKIAKSPFCYSTKFGIKDYVQKYYEEVKKNESY